MIRLVCYLSNIYLSHSVIYGYVNSRRTRTQKCAIGNPSLPFGNYLIIRFRLSLLHQRTAHPLRVRFALVKHIGMRRRSRRRLFAVARTDIRKSWNKFRAPPRERSDRHPILPTNTNLKRTPFVGIGFRFFLLHYFSRRLAFSAVSRFAFFIYSSTRHSAIL